MKLFFSVFALVVFLALISVITPSPVKADSQSEIIQRVDSDTRISNDLLAEVETAGDDPESILAILLREIPIITNHWRQSSAFYESKIASENDEELKAILININDSINNLSTNLLIVEEAINNGDEEAYLSAFTEYDRQMDFLNSNILALNNHLGAADYSWLAWPFWIALIISIFLFIISRGNPILPAEQLRNKFEFTLFKSSLWPLGGSAISYFWYLLTPPGETFYVLYGPIAIGYFQFFRGLVDYLRYARPAINLAKTEEKEKLEALIRSDRFQQETMEEMAQEIGRRSGVVDLSKSSSKASKKTK